MRWVVLGSFIPLATLAHSVAHADPPSGASASLPSFVPRLELELPFLKPLRFSFNGDSVPGFEALRLGTYRTEAVWFEKGNLSLQTFGRVAPTLELDCSLTCQPMLERVAGAEGRFNLGAAGRAIPASYLFVRGQTSHVAPSVPGTRSLQRTNGFSLGIGGLLDF